VGRQKNQHQPHERTILQSTSGGFAAALATGLLGLPTAYAATIVQTGGVTETNWNNAPIWNGTAATVGNDYVTAAGLIAANSSGLGAANDLTGRVRTTGGGSVFAGDSLRIVTSTELLIKQEDGSTSTGNLILDGGIIRYSPNNNSTSATLAGTLNITSASVIGVVRTVGPSTLTIGSTLTGGADVRLAAGQANTNVLIFNGDLSGYTGTFNVGGGSSLLTLNLAQEYFLPNLGLAYGDFATADRLNLTHDISIGSFSFGGSSLAAGTYTATELNDEYSAGSRFFGDATLTVIPEPSAALLGGLGLLGLLCRRRA
jgi:hypothetical protein